MREAEDKQRGEGEWEGRRGETEGSILSRHSSPFNDFAANQTPLVQGEAAAAKEVEKDGREG